MRCAGCIDRLSFASVDSRDDLESLQESAEKMQKLRRVLIGIGLLLLAATIATSISFSVTEICTRDEVIAIAVCGSVCSLTLMIIGFCSSLEREEDDLSSDGLSLQRSSNRIWTEFVDNTMTYPFTTYYETSYQTDLGAHVLRYMPQPNLGVFQGLISDYQSLKRDFHEEVSRIDALPEDERASATELNLQNFENVKGTINQAWQDSCAAFPLPRTLG